MTVTLSAFTFSILLSLALFGGFVIVASVYAAIVVTLANGRQRDEDQPCEDIEFARDMEARRRRAMASYRQPEQWRETSKPRSKDKTHETK